MRQLPVIVTPEKGTVWDFLRWVEEDDNGCWLWTGALVGRDGRGVYGGIYAHRYAYQEFVGAIPDGHGVLHKCDVPRCVNPKHLFTGTHSDNMQDAFRKGRRSVVGVKNPRCILTEDQVKEIRRRYPFESGKDLAIEFGLDRTQPWRIYNRVTWRHVV